MYCTKCGKNIRDDSKFCDGCGSGVGTNSTVEPTNYGTSDNQSYGTGYNQQSYVQNANQTRSSRSRAATALLCFFFGVLGIHRFYVGKTGTGILWLFTAGCFGIGTFIDFIVILCGGFTDGNGNVIK